TRNQAPPWRLISPFSPYCRVNCAPLDAMTRSSGALKSLSVSERIGRGVCPAHSDTQFRRRPGVWGCPSNHLSGGRAGKKTLGTHVDADLVGRQRLTDD